MMSRRGVVGEILVIIALLASITILVATFSGTNDVPLVQKQSLNALQDIRDLISRALLNWLHHGVIDQPIACNGIYPVDTALLTASLEPYVRSELSGAGGQKGNVTVQPGVLAGIAFQGKEGITVTLANGSIVYKDGSIYAVDNLSKDYFFNVRLPLALGVVDDWLACDAGNLSLHLAQEYGIECFFGKKNPKYPGGCYIHDPKIFLSQEDRDYMMSKAITLDDVARGSQRSIDELNGYFAGKSSCRQPQLSGDSGITCSYQIQDFSMINEIMPWISKLLVVDKDPSNIDVRSGEARIILSNLPDSFDIKAFMASDAHVWTLPPGVEYGPMDDAELSCPVADRGDVQWSIPRIDVPVDNESFNLVSGVQKSDGGLPIMYVNTTRGAIFRLVVKCKDNQVSLLGQPLEYTFTARYGLKQHCGQPKYMMNGNYMCGGCSLKPGVKIDHCIGPGMPWSCGAYENRCNMGMIWQNFIEEGATPANPEWVYQVRGTEAASAQATIDMYPDLQVLINMTCGTVMGHQDKYPPPSPPPGYNYCFSDPKNPAGTKLPSCCMGAYAYNCCGVPGYNETCSPDSSLNNPSCFTSDPTYLGMCTQPKSCERSGYSLNDKCTKYECDLGQGIVSAEGEGGDACGPSPDLDYGAPCNGGGGCYKCRPQGDPQEGVCLFDTTMQGQPCTPAGRPEIFCQTYACDESKGCVGTPANEGKKCSSPFAGSAACSTFECAGGYCMSSPDTSKVGTDCGTEPDMIGGQSCIITKRCTTSGVCLPSRDPDDISCTTPPPPQPPGFCTCTGCYLGGTDGSKCCHPDGTCS